MFSQKKIPAFGKQTCAIKDWVLWVERGMSYHLTDESIWLWELNVEEKQRKSCQMKSADGHTLYADCSGTFGVVQFKGKL